MSMLKQGVTPEEIQIYELYLQRIMKEYDLNWNRFKIYFGFNSGVLVVISYLIQPYLSTTFHKIPNQLLGIIFLLSIIGFSFSVFWFLVNLDGRKWQNLMNKAIEKVEASLFEEKDCALYTQINANYLNSKPKIDVVDINIYIMSIFFLIWLLLAFLSTYAYWVKP